MQPCRKCCIDIASIADLLSQGKSIVYRINHQKFAATRCNTFEKRQVCCKGKEGALAGLLTEGGLASNVPPLSRSAGNGPPSAFCLNVSRASRYVRPSGLGQLLFRCTGVVT